MLEHKAGKEEAVYRHIMELQKEKEKKGKKWKLLVLKIQTKKL